MDSLNVDATGHEAPGPGFDLDAILGRRLHPERDSELVGLLLDRRCGRARELAVELHARQELWNRAFAALFPGAGSITHSTPLDGSGIRSHNLLARGNLRSWHALAAITPLQLSTMRNLGLKSFIEVIELLLIAWAEHVARGGDLDDEALTPAEAEPRRVQLADHLPDVAAEPEPRRVQLADHLPDVAEILRWLWTETGAETIGEALASWDPATAPDEIRLAARRVVDAKIADHLALEQASEQSWRALLLDFSERELEVLRERVYAGHPKTTLHDLGERLGVTRERVRQIEKATADRIALRLAAEPRCGGLRHLAARVRRDVGSSIADEATALAVIDSAVAMSSEPAVADPLRAGILLDLAGPYTRDDGLLVSEAGRGRLDAARSQVAVTPPEVLLPATWFDEVMTDLGAPDDLRDRIEAHLRVKRLGDHYVVWRGSLADRAVAVLAASGETLSITDLHEAIGFDTNPRSLAGQVQGDRRVMRRGKDRYGLRTWGGEEYTGILDELEQAIERAGGSVHLETIVEQFVAEFGVSAQSVRAYANDRRFIRRPEGHVGLRTADDPEVAYRRPPVDTTAGTSLLEGVWHVRFEVDHEMLRGSGRLVRQGVVIAAGLEPDLTLGFDYDGVDVTFSWSGTQPNVGSLRALAHAHGCGEGDLLFLPLSGPEPRGCRVVRAPVLERAGGVRRLALELGLGPDDVLEDGPQAIAPTLGLPRGADWHDVVDRLRDRGEASLVELIPAEWR